MYLDKARFSDPIILTHSPFSLSLVTCLPFTLYFYPSFSPLSLSLSLLLSLSRNICLPFTLLFFSLFFLFLSLSPSQLFPSLSLSFLFLFPISLSLSSSLLNSPPSKKIWFLLFPSFDKSPLKWSSRFFPQFWIWFFELQILRNGKVADWTKFFYKHFPWTLCNCEKSQKSFEIVKNCIIHDCVDTMSVLSC